MSVDVTTIAANYFITFVFSSHFPADKYPSYEEAGKNVDLILYAHHFSEKPVRALVPGLIEIGGIQLNDKPNALPKVEIKT